MSNKQGQLIYLHGRLWVDLIFTCRLKQPCIYFLPPQSKPLNSRTNSPGCLASTDSFSQWTVDSGQKKVSGQLTEGSSATDYVTDEWKKFCFIFIKFAASRNIWKNREFAIARWPQKPGFYENFATSNEKYTKKPGFSPGAKDSRFASWKKIGCLWASYKPYTEQISSQKIRIPRSENLLKISVESLNY